MSESEREKWAMHASSGSSERETPRRLNAATVLGMMHDERMAQVTRSSEPSVSVECDDTAKGDTTPTIKIYAPLGCDTDALAAHAARVAEIAVATHQDVRSKFPRAL